ncbi:MAG: BrnT family toxin [Pseudomonadota bacterium]
MKLPIAGFEWDEGNSTKCCKHGLSVAEIENFLRQDDNNIVADFKHSRQQEQRLIAAGKLGKRFIFVGFTLRSKEGGILIRPISARYMREKEAKRYGEKTT